MKVVLYPRDFIFVISPSATFSQTSTSPTYPTMSDSESPAGTIDIIVKYVLSFPVSTIH